MKKLKLSLIATALLFSTLITINQGCKKYPDGPALSFTTRKARVANTWKVENYKINDKDFTSLVSGYTETFTKSGDYSYAWGLFDGKGTWSFQNKDTEIKLAGTDDHSSRQLFILKLEQKAFWYYYKEGSERHELHLISK